MMTDPDDSRPECQQCMRALRWTEAGRLCQDCTMAERRAEAERHRRAGVSLMCAVCSVKPRWPGLEECYSCWLKDSQNAHTRARAARNVHAPGASPPKPERTLRGRLG